MATILDFRQSPRAERTVPAGTPDRRAEVVIFPGVRYERIGEPAPSRSRRARNRDRLEIDD